MNRRIVVAGSSVTAGQLKELFRQIDDGSLGFQDMRSFLEHRNPFHTNVGRAIEILGESKVITKEQVGEVFGYERASSFPNEVSYREVTLRDCAVLNKSGETDWRLVYGLPLSLRQQRETIGTDTNNQPCFYSNDWWMDNKEDVWAKSQPEAGYYLIDFKGRFGGTTWEGQNSRIAEMGDAYERADERVFVQALISFLKIYAEQLYLAKYHWGRILGSYGHPLAVCSYGSLGIHLRNDLFDYRLRDVFVSVFRKWEF